MGYWPKKVKRRRGHWVNNLGNKLVLLGVRGEHSYAWPNHPRLSMKVYYIEHDHHNFYVQGYSEGAVIVRMARQLEII